MKKEIGEPKKSLSSGSSELTKIGANAVRTGVRAGVLEFQDGDDIILRKRPGRTKYANLILP